MRQIMASDDVLQFVPVGHNPARLFGMDARERACRLAANQGFECADAASPGRPVLIANMAFAWDPAWLKAMRERPRTQAQFSIGESVKVISGPLSDFSGEISEINQDAQRLKVLVSIFGRETPVEVGYDQVKKI